ncbi:MAG: hypothetical protein KDE33_19470 [Bacteroidetes bacterium]|nr:hypothetical protein [Bacteroidota bacterium]
MVNPKKLVGIAAVLGVLIVIFLVVVGIQKHQYKVSLLKNGIRTQAQIVDIIEVSNKEYAKGRKFKRTKHFLELALFEQDSLNTQPLETQEKKDIKSGEDVVDSLFDKIGVKPIAYGEYKKVRVQVAGENYKGKKIGDWVTFVYLPNEAEKGLLLDQLQ